MSNGYPLPFIRSISSMQKPSTPPEDPDDEEPQEKPLVMMIPYVSGMSERIRKACEKFDLKVVFKSGPTLRSLLTRVKDTCHSMTCPPSDVTTSPPDS